MKSDIDYGAIRRDLALLCCRMRGLNPDHVPDGQTEPMWRSGPISDAVDVMMAVTGSTWAAQPYIDLSERIQAREDAELRAPTAIDLVERRAFSAVIGHIAQVVDEVLALPRDAEVVIIFNDLVIPVQPDDDAETVLRRWSARHAKAGRD